MKIRNEKLRMNRTQADVSIAHNLSHVALRRRINDSIVKKEKMCEIINTQDILIVSTLVISNRARDMISFNSFKRYKHRVCGHLGFVPNIHVRLDSQFVF